ncbi:MAG: TIGR00730 family Rossman fold protein [Ruminococcaceae bacterium]|nr:TIGR00730 family Rossman fold protein [Oscillospiraceae bacterium]
MSKQFFVCLYGGASDNISDVHKDAVKELCGNLAKQGFSLVYGAGATGCMGAAARGFRENGGYIMGVTPRFMGDFEDIFDCDNTIKVDTMAERKTLMEKHADLYLIAPGGIGTMDEFFQIITLKYLEQMETPIVILNLDGFYDSLLALMDSLIAQKAAGEKIRTLYHVVTDIEDENLQSMLAEIKK